MEVLVTFVDSWIFFKYSTCLVVWACASTREQRIARCPYYRKETLQGRKARVKEIRATLRGGLAGGWVEYDHPIPSTDLTKFFAKHRYAIIAEQILSGDRSRRKAISMGTPGIAKSHFLIKLLQKFVKQRKRVLFINRPGVI